jgi:hypothetical protein
MESFHAVPAAGSGSHHPRTLLAQACCVCFHGDPKVFRVAAGVLTKQQCEDVCISARPGRHGVALYFKGTQAFGGRSPRQVQPGCHYPLNGKWLQPQHTRNGKHVLCPSPSVLAAAGVTCEQLYW